MRQVLGAALALTLLPSSAFAEDRYLLRQDQTGLNLPGVTLPQGFDEVRAADGTSCRSSNAGAGAYADVGVVGSNDTNNTMNSGAVYGRVVIPLGQTGTRLDCRRLYDLEIQRLQSEVRLLKAGLSSSRSMEAESAAPHPSLEEGWTGAGSSETLQPATTGSIAPGGAQLAQAAPTAEPAQVRPLRAGQGAKRQPKRQAAGSGLRGSLAD